MNHRIRLLTLAFAAFVLLSHDMAFAQGRRYTPRRPTMPSQLNYFRRDVGLLDQYNTFINPASALQSRLNQIEQKQETDRQAIQQQGESINEAQAAATGTNSGFGNLSHYYPSKKQSSRGGSARKP